jgi:2-polyprenyl-3-methyl-5-hydroxy-6-metoxy-1,4-benzoquinol methylase
MGGDLSPLINLGSSTDVFRKVESPWVDRLLFQPLHDRGVDVVHVDLAAAPGVDLVADIMTEDGLAKLRAIGPKTVMLCNVLEHVLNPQLFAQRAFDILQPGGRLIISVPRSYPHHRAPIDTMFRPDPEEVADLLPDAALAYGTILKTSSYWEDVKKRPWILLRQILRAPFPYLGWARYKRTMKKLYWLVHPYKVTIVILEKPAEAQASTAEIDLRISDWAAA